VPTEFWLPTKPQPTTWHSRSLTPTPLRSPLPSPHNPATQHLHLPFTYLFPLSPHQHALLGINSPERHVAPAPGWHVATPERVAIKSTNPPRISPASTPRARPTTARAVTSDPLSCTQAVLASACRRKRLSSHGVKSALAARLRNAGVVPDFFSHAFNHFQ